MWPLAVNRQRIFVRQLVLSLGLGVVVAAVEISVGFAWLRGVSDRLVVPVVSANRAVITGLTAPYRWLRAGYQAAQRIQELEQRYSEVLAQVGEVESLRSENQALRAMLDQGAVTQRARIVSHPIVSLAQPAIASGQADGVTTGQMVLVAGTLVGTVGPTSAHQAQVVLLNSQQHQPILVQTAAGIQGLVVGDGRNVLLTEIPKEATVEIGQSVLTWGQPGVAKDILVGRVRNIRRDSSAPVQTAVLDQLIDFYQAPIVEVR